jgi:hypothetical protein
MNRYMEYQVALLNGDCTETYDSTALLAANNLEAVDKAKRWIVSVCYIAEDARLQINLNGMGIMSLRPGEF